MLMFLVGGAFYLVGVAVILVLRPAIMFTPDGNWKEFGIGKDTTHFTAFPFWLFCLVWAMASYGLAVLLMGSGRSRNTSERIYQEPSYELPPGYYMLNRKTKNGVPKYVFIGAEMGED